MVKENGNGSNTVNENGSSTRQESLKWIPTIGAVLMLTVACVALFATSYMQYHAPLFNGSATTETESDSGFSLKGTFSVNTEIEGETHRLVCYHATVTDFKISEDEAKADQIGADEKFTTWIQPDGSISYHATYYEQLNEDIGIKVTKDFMDCGAGSQNLLTEADIPFAIDFNFSTKYLSGIMNMMGAKTVPAEAFNQR